MRVHMYADTGAGVTLILVRVQPPDVGAAGKAEVAVDQKRSGLLGLSSVVTRPHVETENGGRQEKGEKPVEAGGHSYRGVLTELTLVFSLVSWVVC